MDHSICILMPSSYSRHICFRDTLLSDGHLRGNFIGAYDSDTEEAENNSMWLFPPPEGLSATTSFKNTKVLCERQDRWLLVNIQDPLVFASHDLNRVVWSDDTVQSIIHTSFVFWQVGTKERKIDYFCLVQLSSDACTWCIFHYLSSFYFIHSTNRPLSLSHFVFLLSIRSARIPLNKHKISC